MFSSIVLASLGLAAQASAAPAATCTRDSLQAVASAYLKALSAGTASSLSVASPLTYTENDVALDVSKGVLAAPVTVDFSRTLLDTTACAAMVEVTAATSKHPYVLHTQLRVGADGKVTKVDSVVTDDGDWVFNATAHLVYNKQETWAAIPAAKQSSRAVIQAAADAYLDNWGAPDLPVPEGTPCARLEGGTYTGTKNATANTCHMGAFPVPLKVANRRYVIDEEVGAVSVLNGFPWLEASKPAEYSTPSSNMFRIEDGKIRYIHELTVCASVQCGRTQPGK